MGIGLGTWLVIAAAWASDEGPVVLRGGHLPGGAASEVLMEHGRIGRVEDLPSGARRVDVRGQTLVPGLMDSHVHLSYWPVHDRLPPTGIVAVVDLAAPLSALDAVHPTLRVVHAGPMVTAVGGYPTTSWGKNGYGLLCTSASEATEAVDRLHAAGARVLKLPLDGAPRLSEASLRAASERAHQLGMKVASHAMDDASVRLASAIGVDVLAHTPTAALSDEAIAAWSGRAVISTLAAFGGGPTAVDNLRRLREGGATVLYGTDMGNRRLAGVDEAELVLLTEAGLDGRAILDAMTVAPAAFWGLTDLGALVPGAPAHVVVLPGDPTVDPRVLAHPSRVYLGGMLQP